MLSFGPYQKTRDEKYIVILQYETDSDGNYCQIYTDENRTVVTEQVLDKEKNVLCQIVQKPDTLLQVLTYYGGSGRLTIQSVKMIPVWLLCAVIFVGILPLSVSLLCKKEVSKVVETIGIPIQLVLFISTIGYLDNVVLSAKESLWVILLFITNVLLFYSHLLQEFGKKELIFYQSVFTCIIAEWINVIAFDFDYMMLFLSALISVVVLYAAYCIRNKRGSCISMFLITMIFVVYNIIQYMYYLYFKDFFTVKIIHLFTTAMEASASITELFTREVIGYLALLCLYVIVCVSSKWIIKCLRLFKSFRIY